MELFLRVRGFVLHRFFPLVSRTFSPVLVNNDPFAGLSQAVWADAIFIRDPTWLDTLAPTQLLVAAAILHGCYASHDIAYRLLAEHGGREGGILAACYLAGLQ